MPNSEGSILDLAIAKVDDPSLRATLEREVGLLRDSRSFGLVFDRHLPESVRLPNHPVRVGVHVTRRDESSTTVWRVERFVGSGARRRAVLDDGTKAAVKDLVVMREFGAPVYPGLRSIAQHRDAADPSAPAHVIIKGENFHVLQALRATHARSVDLIYIDPPYNTGGKSSWIYNDRYVDNTDRTKSSKWLSFMERRLLIAKDLLKDTGAIFVSIDDNEQHRLRMLLDQIFKPENFVQTLAVEMSTTSGPKVVNAQEGTIVKNVEFVHIYRRTAAFDAEVAHTPLFDGVPDYDTHYSLWLNDDGTFGSLGDQMMATPAVRAEIERLRLASRGTFSVNNMNTLLAVSEVATTFIHNNATRIARTDRPPVTAEGLEAPMGGYKAHQVGGRVYILTTLNNGTVQQVVPLSFNYRTSDDYKPRYGRTVIRGDLWKGFHQDMGNVAREGGVAFNNGKKPVRLLKQLLRWANNSPDAVILDFFGGSGSTVHAVMEMNAEDGGRRQGILVTNNEVGQKAAAALRRRGVHPGDADWEKQGVFEA